jgi:hypothetical protein
LIDHCIKLSDRSSKSPQNSSQNTQEIKKSTTVIYYCLHPILCIVTMSSLLSIAQNCLGGADFTAATNVAAEKIHLALKTRRGLPDNTAEAEIQGENLQLYFTVMIQILATTPIPCNHAFDADLNPNNLNSCRCCQSKTLLLYAGQWFKNVRITFPEHDDYKDLGTGEYPVWYIIHPTPY